METPGIRQTRIAYDARRVIAKSNEYDFALRKAPEKVEPLSVSEVEEMLKAPAIVWLKRYLGVAGKKTPVTRGMLRSANGRTTGSRA